mgnify:CR=1 FL=1
MRSPLKRTFDQDILLKGIMAFMGQVKETKAREIREWLKNTYGVEITRPSLHRLLKRLEDDGYLESEGGLGRKGKIWRITEEGIEYVRKQIIEDESFKRKTQHLRIMADKITKELEKVKKATATFPILRFRAPKDRPTEPEILIMDMGIKDRDYVKEVVECVAKHKPDLEDLAEYIKLGIWEWAHGRLPELWDMVERVTSEPNASLIGDITIAACDIAKELRRAVYEKGLFAATFTIRNRQLGKRFLLYVVGMPEEKVPKRFRDPQTEDYWLLPWGFLWSMLWWGGHYEEWGEKAWENVKSSLYEFSPGVKEYVEKKLKLR